MPLIEGIIAGVAANSAVVTASAVHDRFRQWRQADDPVATTFNDALSDRIEARANEMNDLALYNVAKNWNVITEEIDTYGTVFDFEVEAIDWLVEEVTNHEGIDLDDDTQTELRRLIADEYADAVSDFREQVASDENLQQDFQEDIGVAILDQLNALRRGFRRIADPGAYTLYEFPAQRDEILDTLLPGDTIPFAERPEVPDTPTPSKQFVIGPLGAGKSRIIAEHINRFSADAFDFVLIPDQQRFLSQEDARALGRQSFYGSIVHIDIGPEYSQFEAVQNKLTQLPKPEQIFVAPDQEYQAVLPDNRSLLHSLLEIQNTDEWHDRLFHLNAFAVLADQSWAYRSVPRESYIREINAGGENRLIKRAT